MPFSRLASTDSSAQGTTQVVTVHGEIDLSSVAKVQRAIDAALGAQPETLMLDLSAIDFCDSSGIRMVVAAQRRASAQGARLVVVRPEGPAWRAFELCRVDGEVDFVAASERDGGRG